MLERASTCIETGRRQLFRDSKRYLRSRRILHPSFWHHGASDLVLPVWWTSSSTLDHATGDNEERNSTATTARYHDGPLLEFLYPEKTLALIRRLSAHSPDVVGPRRRHIHGPGVRQFSTSQWEPKDGEAIDNLEVIRAKEEIEELLLKVAADVALRDLLKKERPEKQELAWLLYSAIPDSQRTSQMQVDLLGYLASRDMSLVASRVLQIFDSIPLESRCAACYQHAVSAYVALKMVGPAIQLLEEAALRFDSVQIGTDFAMKRTVHDDQWDLSLRIFRSFLRQADRLNTNANAHLRPKYRDSLDAVWGQVAQLPDLAEHLQSFLDHVRQFWHELNTTDEHRRTLALFVNGFVSTVMNRVIHTSEPDEDQIWDFFVNLFRDLRTANLPTSELFEYAIRTMIDTPRYREYTNQRKIFLELYRQYRHQFLQGSGDRPSRYLISRLIMQHGEKDSRRIDSMVHDLRTFHPKDPFTPWTLSCLVRFYANHGVVDRVHEFFNEIRSRFPHSVDLNILSSLPYVYARRVDVPGAVEQFKRINTEFGFIPDAACWNALLLAFTRADDLDGALQCFNDCLDSGIEPNIYTFGPMLDLCAARGDVEAFEGLYSRAKQFKVPVETDRRARSSYVQAFLNDDDPEGAKAILQSMLQSWNAGTLRGDSLTHAWNLLITYYALQGDLVSSRRVYGEMKDNNIPMDSWTYAGLMRALIQVKQTNAAYKLLRVTMPANNVRVHAFHYAITITGFLREGQYEHARRVHDRMIKRQVPQTESSRQAALLSMSITELTKLKQEGVKDDRARLVAIEEQLRQNITADYGSEIAHDQPTHRRYIDSRRLNGIPDGYFALVIMLYTARGAYDICKQLFETASQAKPGEEIHTTPIVLLTAIMETHFKAKEYDQVEKCWGLARTEADRLVKTVQQIVHPVSSTPEFGSITDPLIQVRHEQSPIANNRRQVLFRAARIYIRSLIAQENTTATLQAQRTIRNLLTNGFIIDNLTWNEFIQHLALQNRIIDAFSACEMYLMPAFPGWAQLNPAYVRRDRPGFQWMELRHDDIKRTTVLPRYKTLVIFAATMARIKQDETNGLGYQPKMGRWLREVLEQIAPMTVRAVETMPRTGDFLQTKYLYGL